jgi:hypothetical protein
VPQHAYLDSYGDGWTCERGYRKDSAACAVITLPANGYANNESYGSGWDCARGLHQVGESCVAVMAAQRTSDYTGNDWTCDDGDQKQRPECTAK